MELDATVEMGMVEQAQRGDREAFCALVDQYRERVIDVVYRMCGDPALAEDAAQITFLRAWQNLPRYQPRAAFRSWLYRIAVNAALDMLRRERPTAPVDALELPSADPQPEAAYEEQERARLVRRAVLALPESSRAALVLREYHGLSYKEIAEALDISMGTVMSRLNYARTKLLESLSSYLEVA
ncbi:MAG TPA: sigma-70 family RNA polymerase sigma factor [Anaerolineaceae bacterium]